jgi:hypothetical protein
MIDRFTSAAAKLLSGDPYRRLLMRWRQFTIWIPVPKLRLSRSFSLRFMLLFIAIVAAVLRIYWPTRRATAVIQLPAAPSGATNSEASIHAQTQVALLKSPFVVSSALRRTDVRGLAILRRRERPMKWIESQLNVGLLEGGETARVTLTAREGDAGELKLIVDAIVEAYRREILAQ